MEASWATARLICIRIGTRALLTPNDYSAMEPMTSNERVCLWILVLRTLRIVDGGLVETREADEQGISGPGFNGRDESDWTDLHT